MPAFSSNASCFQARWSCANDHDLALNVGFRNVVWHVEFAAGGSVMDTVGGTSLIDSVQTVVGANARPDIAFAPLYDLTHDMWIGHMGPGHSDHVKLARRDGISCSGYVRDLRSMERRELRCSADLSRKLKVRRVRHALNWNDIR